MTDDATFDALDPFDALRRPDAPIAPDESSAAGTKPARRSTASTSAIGACETATVGASMRTCNPSRAGAEMAWANSAGSSHLMNDVAMPTRSCPCLRATSSIR